MNQDWSELSDGELWAAAAADAYAFGELFDRHSTRVYSHCFRRTGQWSDAEDLTAVVFLEAWRRRPELRLDADGSILTWLLAVANNVVRNRDRSVRRHRRLLEKLPEAVDVPDLADEAAGRVDDERRIAPVVKAMKTMRPNEQDVLALCVLAGLDYASAASALGVPVGTVRSRLSRALKHLRELLAVPDGANRRLTVPAREAAAPTSPSPE
jgi:RNA polymerase sigma factor (sigma-70 family)